jgi:hypothetical protein
MRFSSMRSTKLDGMSSFSFSTVARARPCHDSAEKSDEVAPPHRVYPHSPRVTP